MVSIIMQVDSLDADGRMRCFDIGLVYVDSAGMNAIMSSWCTRDRY